MTNSKDAGRAATIDLNELQVVSMRTSENHICIRFILVGIDESKLEDIQIHELCFSRPSITPQEIERAIKEVKQGEIAVTTIEKDGTFYTSITENYAAPIADFSSERPVVQIGPYTLADAQDRLNSYRQALDDVFSFSSDTSAESPQAILAQIKNALTWRIRNLQDRLRSQPESSDLKAKLAEIQDFEEEVRRTIG